jgi:hypothetical protein
MTVVVPSRRPDPALLARWGPLAKLPGVHEVLVVCPRGAVSPARSSPRGVQLLEAPLGRASQMNAGAAAARGELLFFVHGDTTIDAEALDAIARALRAEPDVAFALSLRFDSPRASFRILERMARVRDRLLPFPLGDQGLALRRSRFLELGGFPDEPLFEDVVMTLRLRRAGTVRVLPEVARTDAGRFESAGPWRTFLRNVLLVAAHALGAPPRALVRSYYGRGYLDRWLAARESPPVIRPPAAWYPRGRSAAGSLPPGVRPWSRSDPSLPR